MSDSDLTDMAEALRWLRERIGISREQLAAAAGISAVYIKFIERGKRNPSEAVIQRLLPALRVTRADLDGLLRLRPWATSMAAGGRATLSAYAAAMPLAVGEGSEFDASAAPPPTPLAAAPPPPPAPLAAAPPMPMFRAAPTTQMDALSPAGSPPASPAPSAASASPGPAAAPGPAAPPEPEREPEPPPTLDAELIELRERYVHLPRSKQEMVLGWLRALDDR